MNTAFQVIDDFCDRADEVRASAFTGGFETITPGRGTPYESSLDGMGFIGTHAPLMQGILKATGKMAVPNLMHFRLTTKETECAVVHSDKHAGNHTALVYLSIHEKKHGTAFWRHRGTGSNELTEVNSREALHDISKGDMSDWEMTDFVEGRYNRALIFRAPLFHSRFPIEDFGETNGNGRLIWACHFNYLHEMP
jgi:hypothetical protein